VNLLSEEQSYHFTRVAWATVVRHEELEEREDTKKRRAAFHVRLKPDTTDATRRRSSKHAVRPVRCAARRNRLDTHLPKNGDASTPLKFIAFM
jgi:hypothetical protein